MKLQAILPALLFAAVSVGAYAADAEKAPATETKAEQPKPAKPHSHVQEKTGAPQDAAPMAAPEKKNPAKDRTKHFHPRDK